MVKTALLSWLVTVLTIALVVLVLIPRQRRSLMESLHAKAEVAATSINDVASSALVISDYEAVVDHCNQIVGDGHAFPYIVITKNDGFSLVHKPHQWSTEQLAGEWIPGGPRQPRGDIRRTSMTKEEVYQLSMPLDYSGVEWGWIHVGLSLTEFNEAKREMSRSTMLLGLACSVFAFGATLLYARHLVRPIRLLTEVTRRVAHGDLTARAAFRSGDEIETLGNAFNRMASTLERTLGELTAARDYTQNIVTSMNDVLVVVSPDGRLLSANPAARHLLGYEESELLGRSVDDLLVRMPGQTGPSPIWPIRFARDVEGAVRARDGEEIPVLLSIAALSGGGGRDTGYVCVALDLRERRRVERARHDREERLQRRQAALTRLASDRTLHAGDLDEAARLLTESAARTLPAAIASLWLFSPDGTALDCVDWYDQTDERHDRRPTIALSSVPGAAAEVLVGRIVAVDDALAGVGLGRLFDERGPLTALLHAPVRLAGRMVGLLVLGEKGASRPWTLEDINFAGSLGALASLALDGRDRRRTNLELIAARDAAEAASRAKSEFLANVSHELRTPLNAIIGYSELLQEELLDAGDSEVVPDLQRIHSASTHLLGLINTVLDFSKIEAGRVQLSVERFGIAALVDTVATTTRGVVEKNGNAFEVVCPADIGTMEADPVKTRQVLINLLSNAGKFTSRGHVVLRASREEPASGGCDWIRFDVQDDGIGIAADQLPNLFRAFSQGDASTTRKYGGTGLGLVISRRFCVMMGGEVTVDSQPGHGTVFTVRLPAVVPVPAGSDTGDAPPTPAAPGA